jgi:membrane-associated phospholipid phosphatase
LSAGSFPSGHTASAFSMFLVLSHFSKNRWRSFSCFLAAFFVGYSRMYLAQHFFADVYGGAIIAVIMTIVVIYILEKQFSLGDKQSLQKGLLKI